MVRAAVLHGVGDPLTVEDVTLLGPGPGQVLVRLAAAGVCHSDLSLSNGTLRQVVPAVLGHEGSGIVETVGEDVTRVRAGDRVVLCWAPPCRTCRACTRSEPWLCVHANDAANAPYGSLYDGTPVYPGLSTGAFATHTVVGERACVPVPDGVGLEDAALVGCAVATGVGAVLNTAKVAAGERVLVVGLGGVGLSAVQAARLVGASQVIAVDPSEGKLALAQSLGATSVLAPSDQLPKDVRRLTDGEGVDHAFDCVGKASTIRGSWSSTRRGGRVTVVGIGGADEVVSLSSLEVFHFNRLLGSSVYGSVDPDVDFPRILAWVASGDLDLSALVTSRIGLDDVNEAFAAMSRGEGARSLVTFG